MYTLAYVIALMNPYFLNSKDIEVQIGPLYILANDISTRLHLPRDAFKHNSFYRNGDKGFFISKNLKDYLHNDKGDPDAEGLIIILDYQTRRLNPPNDPTPLAYLLHPYDFTEDDKMKVDQYIQTLQSQRNSKTIHELIL